MNDSHFDDFWRASELNAYSVADFARRLAAYEGENATKRLEYPEAPTPLRLPKTALTRLAERRASGRSFGAKPLSGKHIEAIMSAFYAHNGLEHRSYPAAGAIYTVEIFLVLFNAGKLNGKILYYNPETHGYVVIPGQAPLWSEAVSALNIEVDGEPQGLVLFVSFPERAVAKYGERGGRFVLFEVGAAMQQLALTIAGNRDLRGVAVGGTMDAYWLKLLGLTHTDARIALGYLVGV